MCGGEEQCTAICADKKEMIGSVQITSTEMGNICDTVVNLTHLSAATSLNITEQVATKLTNPKRSKAFPFLVPLSTTDAIDASGASVIPLSKQSKISTNPSVQQSVTNMPRGQEIFSNQSDFVVTKEPTQKSATTQTKTFAKIIKSTSTTELNSPVGTLKDSNVSAGNPTDVTNSIRRNTGTLWSHYVDSLQPEGSSALNEGFEEGREPEKSGSDLIFGFTPYNVISTPIGAGKQSPETISAYSTAKNVLTYIRATKGATQNGASKSVASKKGAALSSDIKKTGGIFDSKAGSERTTALSTVRTIEKVTNANVDTTQKNPDTVRRLINST
ncbi:unnamed protein product [Strongylus vulgaris]|uniref:Uncharacterized protein n=1 Tax=Strongylus vulgaris TaxID=40348 RepID=A0A3P7KIX2_STRVU|nr:unnamed protein product [Strongylus vulgaris]